MERTFSERLKEWAENEHEIRAIVRLSTESDSRNGEECYCIISSNPAALAETPEVFGRIGRIRSAEPQETTLSYTFRVLYEDESEIEFSIVGKSWLSKPLDSATYKVLSCGYSVITDKDDAFCGIEALLENEFTRKREAIITSYFGMWLSKDWVFLTEFFSDEIDYTESDGKEYCGLTELTRWFRRWNKYGSVIEWKAKAFVHQNDMVAAEWRFVCEFDGNKSCLDGVSLFTFDYNNKITRVKEFAASAEHIRPCAEKNEETKK